MTPKYNTQTGEAIGSPPLPFDASYPPLNSPHHVAARGFGQMFGLHPAMAFLTLIVDSMLFAGEGVTFGTSLPFSVAVAVILGFITYRAQMKWYGDDDESAKIKALILALLTAIPTPLPAMFYVPAGVVGFVHQLRKR